HGTRLNGTEVCFESATVTHPKATVEIIDGCVKRDKSLVRASFVSVPFQAPLPIPGVEPEQKIEVHGLEVEPEKQVVRFDRVIGGWFAVQGPARASIAGDMAFLKAP